jgi:dihydroorotate dehydrogenase electron transfer subunit
MQVVASRDQYPAKVLENTFLCREHYRLTLLVPSFPPTEPGQFVQVACRDTSVSYSPEWEVAWSEGAALGPSGVELMQPLAFLRRPFSLAGRADGADGVRLELIHRIVGVGTSWLSELELGDGVDVLGPLGNRFRLPGPDEVPLLVGGGVGIPPMLYLATKLAGRKGVAFCGALSRDLLPLTIVEGGMTPGADSSEPLMNVDEFARHGVGAVISTDDGSYGFRGFVTQALERYLDRHFPGGSAGGVRPVVYTCGPEPMMKRVAYIAGTRGIECQVAVERAMACGMGTCQSCCIRLRRDPARDGQAFAGKDWIYKLACTDGPVFLGKDLLW